MCTTQPCKTDAPHVLKDHTFRFQATIGGKTPPMGSSPRPGWGAFGDPSEIAVVTAAGDDHSTGSVVDRNTQTVGNPGRLAIERNGAGLCQSDLHPAAASDHRAPRG